MCKMDHVTNTIKSVFFNIVRILFHTPIFFLCVSLFLMTEHYSIRCLFFIIENVFLRFYTILKHILSFIYLFIFLNLSLVINDSSGITESFRGRKVLGVLFHINNFLQSLESIYLFRYNV